MDDQNQIAIRWNVIIMIQTMNAKTMMDTQNQMIQIAIRWNVIIMIQTMNAKTIHPPITLCRASRSATKPKNVLQNFRSCAWMFAGEWSSLYDIEAEFQEVYLPRIPFKVEHMRIYVNINVRKVGNAYCTYVRCYLAGKLAPR